MSEYRIKIDPNRGSVSFRGRFYGYYSKQFQKWIIVKWPRPRGKNSPKQQLSIDDFKKVTELIRSPAYIDNLMAYEQARGVKKLPRDLLAMAAYGTLIEATLTDGTHLVSFREAQLNIQQLLSSLGITNGQMLVCDNGDWVCLNPGDSDDVLTMDAASGQPRWKPQGGGGGIGSMESALVNITSDKTHTLVGGYAIPWDGTEYDSAGFWDSGTPTRLTIPAGFDFCNIHAHVRMDSDSGSNTQALIQQFNASGTQIRQIGAMVEHGTTSSSYYNVNMLGVPVSTGDYFILTMNGPDTSATVNHAFAQTEMSIQAWPSS